MALTLEIYNQSVHEFSDRVCRFVDKMLMDRQLAKDITQEAYLRLWERRDNVDPTKVRAWLFTTAYRLSIDTIHREKKKQLATSYFHEPFTEMASPDLKKIINEALILLTETQRSILLLKDYEGYSYEEIGDILSLNESQVKVYLFRARKKMKDHIGDLRLVL